MSDLVRTEIARRKSTRATGAIVGIRKPIPPKTKPAKDMSTKAVAERQRKREYYQANKDRLNAARRLGRKVQRDAGINAPKRTYIYLPSIAQAKDIRSSGDILEQHYMEVTNALKIWDDNHARAVAHSTNEQKIDIALQAARAPTGQHFAPNYRLRQFQAAPLHNGLDLGSHVDTFYEVLPPLK